MTALVGLRIGKEFLNKHKIFFIAILRLEREGEEEEEK